jgi:hypothetical protein
MAEQHSMNLEELTEEYATFRCPVCDRYVVFSFVTQLIAVITEGDPTAMHDGVTTMGFGFTARAAQDDDPYLNPFKDFLNGL